MCVCVGVCVGVCGKMCLRDEGWGRDDDQTRTAVYAIDQRLPVPGLRHGGGQLDALPGVRLGGSAGAVGRA